MQRLKAPHRPDAQELQHQRHREQCTSTLVESRAKADVRWMTDSIASGKEASVAMVLLTGPSSRPLPQPRVPLAPFSSRVSRLPKDQHGRDCFETSCRERRESPADRHVQPQQWQSPIHWQGESLAKGKEADCAWWVGIRGAKEERHWARLTAAPAPAAPSRSTAAAKVQCQHQSGQGNDSGAPEEWRGARLRECCAGVAAPPPVERVRRQHPGVRVE